MQLNQKLIKNKSFINQKNILFRFNGNSMLPTFKDGWKVIVRPVDTEEISYGDIAVFIQKKIICHRVLGKFRWNKKLYFIHKGDAENIIRIFEEKDLVGKVVEASDADGNIIEQKLWHRSYNSLVKFRLLGYIYLPLFLTKRFLFGKRQNKLTYWIRKSFWHLYCQGYN